jgi:V8-like Glu-specific endopeptidase
MEVTSLAENLFFTTVRVDTVSSSGENGSGTGFVFVHKYKDQEYPFIVTNKHVVAGAKRGGVTFICGNENKPTLGATFRLDFGDFEDQWHGHPDKETDITVIPLVPLVEHVKKQGVDVFFRSISTSNIPNAEQEKQLDAIEEVVFVGYPNGIWDSKNFTPIARKGTTATPLALDYEGKKKFLIDASVFGGSSGSPVFIYQTGVYATKNGPATAGTKFFFVGVVAAVYFKTAANDVVSLPIPTHAKNVAIDKEMIDLGIVFKASTVVEAIESALIKLGV